MHNKVREQYGSDNRTFVRPMRLSCHGRNDGRTYETVQPGCAIEALSLVQIVAQAIDTDSTVISVRQSLATARAFQPSTYDAVYVDLARRERLPLATLDGRLPAAAARAGVEVVH